MATIKEKLLEKADFGKFQKENQEALSTLDKEKRNLRVNRKLKEAKIREKQVKVKFTQDKDPGSVFREALVKTGNKPDPLRVTYRYSRPFNPIRKKLGEKRLYVEGLYQAKKQMFDEGDPRIPDPHIPLNEIKPSQIKKMLNVFAKRYPQAENIVGSRVSGMHDRMGGKMMQRFSLKGKKFGLLGLGLSLGEAIRAGKAAYDAKEGKL